MLIRKTTSFELPPFFFVGRSSKVVYLAVMLLKGLFLYLSADFGDTPTLDDLPVVALFGVTGFELIKIVGISIIASSA